MLVLGATAGVALAYCTGGLSLALLKGLFLGAAGGKVLNVLQGNVDTAKRNLQDSERALQEVEREVQQIKWHIMTLEKQDIENKKHECNMLHKEAKRLKEAVAFKWKLLNSGPCFWKQRMPVLRRSNCRG